MVDHYTGTFANRHIGPRQDSIHHMLGVLGYSTLDEMMDAVVPSDIRQREELLCPIESRALMNQYAIHVNKPCISYTSIQPRLLEHQKALRRTGSIVWLRA